MRTLDEIIAEGIVYEDQAHREEVYRNEECVQKIE